MKLNKLTTISAAILATVAFCGTLSASTQENEESSTKNDGAFRVMSFNIRLATDADGDNAWKFRKETLLEVVRESDPLLLGVQEALWTQMEFLNENLNEYASIGVGRDDGAKKGEFMAIFYKKDALDLLDSGTFWLSPTPDQPGVKGWDAVCNRVVTWGKFRCKATGKTFIYANTHFDHQGTIARKESAKLILRKINELAGGETPFFISGDFNVTEKSEAYRILTTGIDGLPGLRDSNKVAQKREIAQERTFHNWGEVPVEKGSIIDFILVSDKINVEIFKINPDKHSNGRFASDHCSIVATLRLAN